MKNLKKFWAVLSLLTFVFSLSLFSACFRIESNGDVNDLVETFIHDGVFKYLYLEDEDCFAIVGDSGVDNPSTMYVPTHYMGKEIKYIYYGFEHGLYGEWGFGPDFIKAKKVHFGYNAFTGHDREDYYSFHGLVYGENAIFPKTVVFTNLTTDGTMFQEFATEKDWAFRREETYVYAPQKFVEYILTWEAWIGENFEYTKISDREHYFKSLNVTKGSDFTLKIANTSFMFNFEGSPNEDYFFVDEFYYGDKISKPPYDPVRDGYVFDGWFKDQECVEPWDFENDLLPNVFLDENYLEQEFKETKLYAKWKEA